MDEKLRDTVTMSRTDAELVIELLGMVDPMKLNIGEYCRRNRIIEDLKQVTGYGSNRI